jgi:hypothetical protein
MNEDLLSEDQEVERLVGAYLEEQERTVDSARMLASVRRKVAHEMGATKANRAWPAGRGGAAWRRAGWGMGVATAASVLLAFFLWTSRTATLKADVVRLVREAQAVLGERVDRAYRIEIELAPGAAVRHPILAVMASSNSRLWTRGDRYWIEMSRKGKTWAWGRDEARRVWVAPQRKVGLIFEPDEIPASISMIQDFHSLGLDLLMKQLLAEFDIAPAEAADDHRAGVTRIHATIKPGRGDSRIKAVTLEIEDATKLVLRVAVLRAVGDDVPAEVFYTFEKVDPRADEQYRLEGHIDPDASIYGTGERRARRQHLMQFFGSILVSEL